MAGSAAQISETKQLEYKLRWQEEPMQRLLLINQLTASYVFTNIPRAQELLTEQRQLLTTIPHPDFQLDYHLHAATVENQLYEFQSAEANFLAAIELLEERGDVKQQAEVYIDYAGTCMNLDKMDRAGEYLAKASRLLKLFPDKRLQARLTCREGYMNLHYANLSAAIELLLQAEKIITGLPPRDLKDFYFLTLIHSGLGKIYERNDENEKSVAAYTRVVDMCESLGMRTRLSWHYLNIGVGYMALNDQESAESYFRKAIDVSDDISQQARASAYANLGYCHLEKHHYEEALELFEKAESLYREDDFYNFSVIESWRGRLFAENDQTEDAMYHLALAFENAHQIHDYKQLSSICKDIAAIYADLDDYKNAYEYQLLYDKYAEQYAEKINKRKQMELEIKYEAEKKKQEAELLRLQATRLQLKALRAQMNPHFMYNALNSIQNYITSREITSAAKYLAKFAKLMRQSLEYSDLEIISLEKEVEFLDDYLFINEKLRFEDRLHYQITVADDIEEDILGVPTMIVQPYVENAIEHGLRSKKDGMVKVHFSLYDDDTILCLVEDNGIGREKARQLRMNDPNYQNYRSRGTNITQERLQLLHQQSKEKKGVFVHTIDLIDEKDGAPLGTRVEIKIPIVEIQIK